MYAASSCLFVASILFVVCQSTDNSGTRLIRARPHSVDQFEGLANFLSHEEAKGDVDVWGTRNKEVTFAVSRDRLDLCVDWMRANNIDFSIDAKDLKRLAEEDAMRHMVRRTLSGSSIELDQFNDHEEINGFLRTMNSSCSICDIINIGQSYEGRNMEVIKIGRVYRNKKAIWIDAGIHAREWATPATALNIIKYLIDGFHDRDPDVIWMLRKYVWYILPSANPDGYMFSRSDPQNRFWRKTRRPNRRPGCAGTDPNRNWNFHWAEAGTSPDPCSEIFPGPTPFSEVETRNIRDFLLRHRTRLLVYLSLHSYGQYWMYPWGYDSSLPDNWQELDRVGQRAIDAIYEEHSKRYTLGSSTNVLYAAAGASDDWAKGVANITYSYTVEVRDEGNYGFLMPPEEIIPTSEEIWAAIKAMAKAIDENQT